MAQLLVFTRNNTHDDPVKNKQNCYKIGDVVEVYEDSSAWKPSSTDPFDIVHVTGVKSDYEYLTEPKLDSLDKVCLRRAYKWVDGQVVIK
jgi:hypothetical protein